MRMPRPATQDPGLMTLRDLAAYRAKWRTPLRGTYRGRQVIAMPPPTSGGVTVIEMLNLLEGYDLASLSRQSADEVHLIADAQRIAWADRNAYVADPDVVPQRTRQLVSKTYAAARRPEIARYVTHPFAPAVLQPDPAPAGRDANPAGSTTQISVIDVRGGAVALTCAIEQEFGSGVVAPGTGFLLNNELTDFSDPGTANQPGSGKRPRSSMAPTIVVQGHTPLLVTGAAGGSRIIMGVLHTIVNRVDFGSDLAHSVDAERFDDQGTANLEIENGRYDATALADLQARGYTVVGKGEYGPLPRVQAAGTDPRTGLRSAVSDPRSDPGSLRQRVRPRAR
jgi:gamma-glutamyltranspeptidase/glutathione hydrolase